VILEDLYKTMKMAKSWSQTLKLVEKSSVESREFATADSVG
jgi:hypothetical protein